MRACFPRVWIVGATSIHQLSDTAHLAWHSDFQWRFKLLSRFFRGVLELHVIRMEEINTSQFWSIVELLLVTGPMTLFLQIDRCSTYSSSTSNVVFVRLTTTILRGIGDDPSFGT